MDTITIVAGTLAVGFACVSLGLSYKLKKLKGLFENLSKSKGELYSLYVSKQKAISKLEKDLDETKRNNDNLNIQRAHLQMTLEGYMSKQAKMVNSDTTVDTAILEVSEAILETVESIEDKLKIETPKEEVKNTKAPTKGGRGKKPRN